MTAHVPETLDEARDPLSIVLPTHNRPDLLRRCLDHLLVGGLDDDEIVVVDSAPSDDSAERVVAAYDVRYVRVDLPGVSRARNAGWRAASHELVAFIDDDARAHEGFRDAMAHALGDGMAGRHIPDPRRVVGRPGHEAPPVGAELDGVHRGRMAHQIGVPRAGVRGP